MKPLGMAELLFINPDRGSGLRNRLLAPCSKTRHGFVTPVARLACEFSKASECLAEFAVRNAFRGMVEDALRDPVSTNSRCTLRVIGESYARI